MDNLRFNLIRNFDELDTKSNENSIVLLNKLSNNQNNSENLQENSLDRIIFELSKTQHTTSTRKITSTSTTTAIIPIPYEVNKIRKVKKAEFIKKSPNCLSNSINITYQAFRTIDFNEKIDHRINLTQTNGKIYLQINIIPLRDKQKLEIPQNYYGIHLMLDELYLFSSHGLSNQSFIRHG